MDNRLSFLVRMGAGMGVLLGLLGFTPQLYHGLVPLPSAPSALAASNPYAGPCNCTFWAWQRRAELGDQMPGWGDAKTWGASAKSAGYSVSTTPQKYSVAVFQPGAAGAFASGHVAVVEDAWKENGVWKFRVNEANFNGCGPFSNRIITAGSGMEFIYLPVKAPTNLNAAAVSGSSIKFSWSDNTAFESGFSVWRWGGSSWLNIANVGANSTSYTDSGLSTGVTYYYTVCVNSPLGGACASNYAQATTPGNAVPRFCENNAAQGYGRCLDYGPGKYILNNWANDLITTIIIPGGYRWQVTVYEHADPSTGSCFGRGWTFTSSGSRWEINLYENNLQFNDVTSCVIVSRVS